MRYRMSLRPNSLAGQVLIHPLTGEPIQGTDEAGLDYSQLDAQLRKAAISAVVFGILNVLLVPILKVLSLPMAVIFSGFLISLLMNMIIFGLAAWLVEGFRLRWGIWSALLGSIALSFINSIFFRLLAV